MARIVVAMLTPEARCRMVEAIYGLRPVFCDDDGGMLHALQSAVCDALIVGLDATAAEQGARLIAYVRDRYPVIWIVGCLQGHADRLAKVQLTAAASRSGADEIIVDGLDSYAAVYERLHVGTLEAFVLRRVTRVLEGRVTGDVRRFVEHAVRHARRPLSIDEAAAACGVCRQTLARQCRRTGLPTPQEFLAWTRILFAAALLEQRGMTADRIGYRMFSSPSAFRAMLHRHLGVRPSELKARGGFEHALAAFGKSLTQPAHRAEAGQKKCENAP